MSADTHIAYPTGVMETDKTLSPQVAKDVEAFLFMMSLIKKMPDDLIMRLPPTHDSQLPGLETEMYSRLCKIAPALRLSTSAMATCIHQIMAPPRTAPIPKCDKITVTSSTGETKTGYIRSISRLLLRHNIPKDVDDGLRIQCDICEHIFGKRGNFQEHNCKDPPEPDRVCPVCKNPNVKLATFRNYQRHLQECEGEGTASSRKKEAAKARKDALDSALAISEQDYTPQECPICKNDTVIHTWDAFKQHTEKCLAARALKFTPNKDVSVAEPDYKYSCHACPRTFRTAYNLEQHHIGDKCPGKRKSDPAYELPPGIKDTDEDCPQCGKPMQNGRNIARHLKSGQCPIDRAKKMACSKCHKAFRTTSHKENHEKKCNASSSMPKPAPIRATVRATRHQCNTCGYSFVSAEHLATHRNKIHARKNEYQCPRPDCNKQYFTTQKMKEHLLACNFPRYCPYCWLPYTNRKCYEDHSICCDYFSTCLCCLKHLKKREGLKQHIGMKHQSDDIPCDVCGLLFPTSFDLENHSDHFHATLKDTPSSAGISQSPHPEQQTKNTAHHTDHSTKEKKSLVLPDNNREKVPLHSASVAAQLSASSLAVAPSARTRKQQLNLKVPPHHLSQTMENKSENTKKRVSPSSTAAAAHPSGLSLHTATSAHTPKQRLRHMPLPPPPLFTSSDYWSNIIKKMTDCGDDYQKLKAYVETLSLPPVKLNVKATMSLQDAVDTIAVSLCPSDAPKDYVPVVTDIDGNCCPRAIAHGLLHHENHYWEVRARVTVHGIIHESLYLNGHALDVGRPTNKERQLPDFYADMSKYAPPRKHYETIDANFIRKTFRSELVHGCHDAAWWGMWHLHIAANVFRTPIRVVHPAEHWRIRNDLYNRTIYPSVHHDTSNILHLMFTSTVTEKFKYDDDIKQTRLKNINHFVVLLLPHSIK